MNCNYGIYQKFCRFGIGVGNMYPRSFYTPEGHLRAFSTVATFPGYEVLETFLPLDERIKTEELKILQEEGKVINYNFPIGLQSKGEHNPSDLDAGVRRKAIEYAKLHIDNAAEVGSPDIVMTASPDDPEHRDLAMGYFKEYYSEIADYASKYNIVLGMEPIERHRFKKLLYGPTCECVEMIQELRSQGHWNVGLVLDTAHCPTLGEDVMEHMDLLISTVGITHVHLGNAVVDDPSHPFYGHAHPALGIQGGLHDVDHLVAVIEKLWNYGYLEKDRRALMSYEMQVYPGVSPYDSAQIALGKLNTAFFILEEKGVLV